MECIYRPDGSIKKVYDERFHNHPGMLTARLTDEQATVILAGVGDILKLGDTYVAPIRINPNTKEAYSLPTCDGKYIKVVDNVYLEMNVDEKAVVDEAIAAQEARRAELDAMEADRLAAQQTEQPG
jgi:hypothetical protein